MEISYYENITQRYDLIQRNDNLIWHVKIRTQLIKSMHSMIWQSWSIRYITCQPNMQITLLLHIKIKKLLRCSMLFYDYVNGIEQQFGGCILKTTKRNKRKSSSPFLFFPHHLCPHHHHHVYKNSTTYNQKHFGENKEEDSNK